MNNAIAITMKEWEKYNALFNSGAGRPALLKAAQAMKDSGNRTAALMNLGVMTPKQRREVSARWASVEAVTQKEIRAHCQFGGLPSL